MLKTKTPFRYPGSKSRAIDFLLEKFPKNITEYREPFLGGGSLPIAFTKKYHDVPVWVNDLYEPLYNCWLHIQLFPDELIARLLANRNSFKESVDLKEYVKANRHLMFDSSIPALDRAVMYYISNRCSFSGITDSFSLLAGRDEYTVKKIEQLYDYSKIIKNWKITNYSYEELLKDSDDCFLFLDPPYDIKSNDLYGEKGSMHLNFSHRKFHRDVGKLNCNWMITYNYNDVLADMYSNYNLHTWKLTYSLNSQSGKYLESQKKNLELLITNYSWQESNTFKQLFSV